jgi:TolA-binding protein
MAPEVKTAVNAPAAATPVPAQPEKKDQASAQPKMPELSIGDHFERTKKIFSLASDLNIAANWAIAEDQLKKFLGRPDNKEENPLALQAKYMLGVSLLAQGKSAEAKPLLSSYLDTVKKTSSAEGLDEAAFRCAEAATKAAGSDVKALQEAKSRLDDYLKEHKEGKFSKEAAEFLKSVETDLKLHQGWKSYQDKNYQDAIPLLEAYVGSVAKGNDGKVDNRRIAIAAIAKCQGLLGKIEEAKTTLAQLGQEYPGSPLIAEAIGKIADEAILSKKFEQAENILQGAGAEQMLRLGVAQYGLGKYKEACESYQGYLKIHPQDKAAASFLEQATAAIAIEQSKPVKATFNEALKQRTSGNYAESSKGFTAVIAQSKDQALVAKARYLLAEDRCFLGSNGQSEEFKLAKPDLEALLAHPEYGEKAHYHLVESELGLKNFAAAVTQAEAFLKEHGSSKNAAAVEVFCAKGMLGSARELIAAGKNVEAFAVCAEVSNIFGKYCIPALEVRLVLGEIAQASGGSGKECYSQAVTLFSREKYPEKDYPELIELRAEAEKRLKGETK